MDAQTFGKALTGLGFLYGGTELLKGMQRHNDKKKLTGGLILAVSAWLGKEYWFAQGQTSGATVAFQQPSMFNGGMF